MARNHVYIKRLIFAFCFTLFFLSGRGSFVADGVENSHQCLAPPTSLRETQKQRETRLREEYFVEAFQESDGVELIPVVEALMRGNVLSLLPKSGSDRFITLDEIVHRTGAVGPGYVGAGLVAMGMQGWVSVRKIFVPDTDPPLEQWEFGLTPEGEAALAFLEDPAAGMQKAFQRAIAFIGDAICMDDLLFNPQADPEASREYAALVGLAGREWGVPPTDDPAKARVRLQMIRHLDGMIVGPTMVALGMRGHEKGEEAELAGRIVLGEIRNISQIGGNQENLKAAFRLLGQNRREWVSLEPDGAIKLTDRGRQALSRTHLYGAPVSYNPTMKMVYDLMFVNPNPLRYKDGKELLVQRVTNIWGSGKAHKDYFMEALKYQRKIFNNPNLEEQPRGIADMGCGYGTYLKISYENLLKETWRGEKLDAYPVQMVGLDFNQEARDQTSRTLSRAGISTVVVPADIRNPEKAAKDLEALGIDYTDCLHIRSVLDHNREYRDPQQTLGISPGRSQVIFSYRGKLVNNALLEQDLVEYLRSWAKVSRRHGMVVIEGPHAMPPREAAKCLGRTSAIAYYLSHALSDQYTVEWPVFLDCARRAGLEPAGDVVLLRNKKIPVISVAHYKVARPDNATATPALVLPAPEPLESSQILQSL